jgi:hypothetical protein
MTKRQLTRDDLLPLEQYVRDRRALRRRVTELKKQRRVEVGPFATFYFESYDTMWHQVHEMLAIEKGGEAQIEDELRAYNPLIPQGDELVATVMFEVDDPMRRQAVLARLGGVENRLFLSFAGERVPGIADPDRENSTADGKASAVQFLHFPFTAAQKAKFRTPGTQVLVGSDHPNYGHLAVMPESVRQALAEDFAEA